MPLPYGSSTTIRRALRADAPTAPLALCEQGPGYMRPARLALIDAAAAAPVLGAWPLTAAGRRAATRAFDAAALRLGAVEVA